jgi:hypothetical protein
MQQSAKCQGQDEDVDQQEIQREQPDGPPEVRLIDVLDHDDLELAWQENDGKAGKQDQRSPRPGTARIRLQQARQFGRCGRPLEELGKAAEHAVGDEQADCQEGQQLDHRLEGNRRHHAFVALGRIKMACAEKNRKHRQQCCDDEGGVEQRGVEAIARMIEQHLETGRHRLQLQGYIGNYADHRDHRHQAGQQLALAVARGDEVGNRGDPLRFADPDHLDDDPDEQQHQRRPDVDGQERETAGSRAPDAAVEGP